MREDIFIVPEHSVFGFFIFGYSERDSEISSPCMILFKGDFFMRNSNIERTKKLAMIAMFSALAYVTTVVCKLIPDVAGFLSLEIKDAIIVLCSLTLGPVSGLVIAILVPFIELFTISATGWYGLIMNVLSSATFALVVGLIYKRKRTFNGAIIALVSGVFAVTAVMVLANLFITPLYLKYMVGVPATMGYVAEMIPTILLPFNFTKATLNMAIVLLFYKPFSNVLKKTGILKSAEDNVAKNTIFNRRNVVVSVISACIIVLSIVIIFVVIDK